MTASRFNFRAWDGGRMWQKDTESPERWRLNIDDGGQWGVIEFKRGAFHVDRQLLASGPESQLMQSTGLVDVDGVEIFEGDVIRADTGEVGSVEYDYRYPEAVCNFYTKDGRPQSPESWLIYSYPRDFYRRCAKVIGNIYENPELVEAE